MKGNDAGKIFELKPPVTIGRGRDAGIHILDPRISRKHATLRLDEDEILIEDMESRNGTLVNGRAITMAVLEEGDEILIGDTLLRFEGKEPSGIETELARKEGRERVESSLEESSVDLFSSDCGPRLGAIGKLMAFLGDEIELGGLFRRLPKKLAEIFGADEVSIFVRTGAKGLPELLGFYPSSTKREGVQLSHTILTEVESGRAVLVKDIQENKHFSGSESLVGMGALSAMAAPFSWDECFAGFLFLSVLSGRKRFGKAELELLVEVARLVGQAIEKARRYESAFEELRRLKREAGREYRIIAESESIRYVLDLAAKAARAENAVLITGETGTGKELLARRIHDLSPRHKGPFLPVKCAAIPAELLESELFGYERGAFTGATARKPGDFERTDGGSLFLDEIGALPLEVQEKLLRFLQEKELFRMGGTRPVRADVRVIASTNQDLRDETRFRRDLYDHLSEATLRVPPLRNRLDDIPPLCDFLLERIAERLGRRAVKIDPGALDIMKDYDWPGNVREMENVLERAAIMSPGNVIHPSELCLPQIEVPAVTSPPVLSSLRDMEMDHIRRVLEQTGWMREEAARILGISLPALRKKIAKYGLESESSST
jgi:transcriptional regulator with GAF, ATPase, and Fis domain